MSSLQLQQVSNKPKLLDRRAAFRLGMVAVPVVASLAIPTWANASTTPKSSTTTRPVSAFQKSLSIAAADRSQLVLGTYVPSRETTGRIPGSPAVTRIDTDIKATANGQVFENLEVWGRINVGTFSNVVVRNCIVRGTAATGELVSLIYGSGDNLRGLLIEDCALAGRGNVWSGGMRGGNYTIRRTELTWLPDGLSFTSPLGNVNVEGCWIHNGMYAEWSATTPNPPYAGGYYTHVDGIQFHRGKNYTIRGNMIGGVRAVAKHHTSGASTTINNADDLYNSSLMIKQEVDDSLANKVENVLIEKNWFEGGQATINLASGRGNDFSTTVIRNNRFMRSTWGQQYYILRSPGLGQFSNNVFDDDSSPVTISRGA